MVKQNPPLIGLSRLIACAALLAGCSGHSLRPTPDEPSPIDGSGASPAATAPLPSSPPVAPRPPRENHLSPATSSLVAQAHGLTAKGDLDGASSTLDRALRIEPNNPLLWIERGRLRLSENDPKQAEGCARKALVLASGDRAAQTQSRRLLADALRAQKRNQEAHDVETTVPR